MPEHSYEKRLEYAATDAKIVLRSGRKLPTKKPTKQDAEWSSQRCIDGTSPSCSITITQRVRLGDSRRFHRCAACAARCFDREVEYHSRPPIVVRHAGW